MLKKLTLFLTAVAKGSYCMTTDCSVFNNLWVIMQPFVRIFMWKEHKASNKIQ